MRQKVPFGRDPGERVTIACQGCGRTQVLRPWKLQPCDGYYCEGCDFQPPRAPEGMVMIHIYGAAGGFSGYRYEVPDAEQRASLERARALLEAHQQRMRDVN